MSDISGSSDVKPSVLFISLSHLDSEVDEWLDLSVAISRHAFFREAGSEEAALKLLSAPDMRYVLVGDADITFHKHKLLRDCLVEFAKDGGIVVHACLFGVLGAGLDQARYFKQGWGLPWEAARCTGEDVFLNPYGEHKVRRDDLPPSYSFHGQFLRNVAAGDAVYVPPRQMYDSSPPPVPIAFTKIGSGFMGFVGDSTSTKNSISVILAMLGLIDYD